MQIVLGTCQEASEQKVLYKVEVVDGEERLAKLVAEAANIQSPPVVAPQVLELQARIDALLWSGMHCVPVMESMCQPQCRVRGWGVVLLDSKTPTNSHI